MRRLCNWLRISTSFYRFQRGEFVEVLDVAAERSAHAGACTFTRSIELLSHTAVAPYPAVGSGEVRIPRGSRATPDVIPGQNSASRQRSVADETLFFAIGSPCHEK